MQGIAYNLLTLPKESRAKTAEMYHMHPDSKVSEVVQERRVATCPKGGNCEVAERQQLMMRELHEFKQEFKTLTESVEEVVNLLQDAKVVLSFFKGIGTFIRWIAITATAIGTIWAAITHWPKH